MTNKAGSAFAGLLTAVWAGWLCTGSAAVVRAATADDFYTGIYREAVERKMADARLPQRKQTGDLISVALAAWMVGEKTGGERFREFALKLYDETLARPVDHDFHASRPFGLLTLRLQRAGALSGDRRSSALKQAGERVSWFLDKRQFDEAYFDCNIALADTLAVACLARAFGDEPVVRAAEVRQKVTALGRRILATGDLNENACNYASLGICFFLELAGLEGWIDDVRRSEHFRNLFARMRDLVSPAGTIPEYGDGYFAHRDLRLDFVLLLETAARLYGDASFQSVVRLLLAEPRGDVEDDQLHRAYSLMELEPFAMSGGTSPALSTVQVRRVPGEPVRTVPDKLILRTGPRPGDSMIMVDLYARGSHAHEYKRPSIGYYETAGVPLFHNLGRRGTRSGPCGNSFWVFDRPEAFPGYPRTNEWNTMSVPADYCFPAEKPGEYRIGPQLIFRNFRTPGLKYLRLDHLRLEGPAGRLLLDGFESPKTWHGNVAKHPKVKIEASLDRTQGAFSSQINWGVIGEQFCSRYLEDKSRRDTVFRLSDYDTVKFDYRYEGQPPGCNLRGLFKRWIDLGDRPLECDVAGAEARQAGADAWGRMVFARYMGEGNRLERTIVLTAEGALVLADAFTAGARTDGWAGGQLWQLYAMKERGADWFASESDGVYTLPGGAKTERRMLVKFMTGPGVTVGAEPVRPAMMHAPMSDGAPRRSFVTTYSRQRMAAGQRLVAALAVIPLTNDDDPVRLAPRVSLESGKDGGVVVSLPSASDGGPVTIDVGHDGVSVRRAAAGSAGDGPRGMK